jgi:hypothetical protein
MTAVDDVTDSSSTGEQDAGETPDSSRRSLLTKGAVAAAVAAVASGALTQRVHAANGGNFIIGGNNSGTITTNLSGGSTLRVQSGGSVGNASIYGTAPGGSTDDSIYGVRGDNSGSYGSGVYGRTTASLGIGVYGEAVGSTASGAGVLGFSEAGNAVVGNGGAYDLVARGSGRILAFAANPAPGPTAAGAIGTIARDAGGALWYCYAANKWLKLGGPGTAGALHPIAPKRVYDSRPGEAPLMVVKARLNPGENRVIDCTVNASGVPASAKAVALNLTAANTIGRGNLSAYPDGTPVPTSSSLNYTAGVNIANATVCGCGPGAKIRVVCGGSTGADFIVDIVGYYV